MQKYKKPFLTVAEQVNQLERRGMMIEDRDAALSALNNINYYRLSGYWYPFRRRLNNADTHKGNVSRHDTFVETASFNTVMELYVFDQRLRILIFDAIERLEVMLRCQISRVLGKFNAIAYCSNEFKHKIFVDNFVQYSTKNQKARMPEWQRWQDKNIRLMNRSKEQFAAHVKKQYAAPYPIWIITETWDLGQAVWTLKMLRPELCDEIAGHFGWEDGLVFKSAWNTLSKLRNAAAHHCRIWNASFPKVKDIEALKHEPWPEFYRSRSASTAVGRVGFSLLILSSFMRTTTPTSDWSNRLYTHLKTFPKSECGDIQFEGLGLPTGWPEYIQK